MQLHFQECTHADLNTLVEITRKTFVDAFEKDNDPEDFNTYIDKAFDKNNIEQQLGNPDSIFYFVYKDEVLSGYFKLNEHAAQTDIKSEESIELERIYVLQDFQGQKIGQWMLKEVVNLARSMQKEFLWLGVWEKNSRAIAFYENNGFSKFGKHPYYIGKDKQMDWLLRIDL